MLKCIKLFIDERFYLYLIIFLNITIIIFKYNSYIIKKLSIKVLVVLLIIIVIYFLVRYRFFMFFFRYENEVFCSY